MSGISPKTRAIVITRDNHQCQWCGGRVSGSYSLQHRRARMMGGSRVPWINLPGNLVLVHGSGTTECHGWIESHPEEAQERGFRIGPQEVAAEVPLTDWDQARWLLDDDGGKNFHWQEVPVIPLQALIPARRPREGARP